MARVDPVGLESLELLPLSTLQSPLVPEISVVAA